jgi:hypothetical protein
MAAMAALTKQELKEEEGPDSFDILPALTGNPDKPIRKEVVLAAAKGSHLVLREENWAYISAKGGGGFASPKVGSHGFGGPAALKFAGQTNTDVVDGKLKSDAPSSQLYNLSSDRSQSTNVIQDDSERGESMRARLAAIKAGRATRPGVAQGSEAGTSTPRPNLVFMKIDDLGIKAVSRSGGESFKTPSIDRLARKGLKFDRAITAPMCLIARARLLPVR